MFTSSFLDKKKFKFLPYLKLISEIAEELNYKTYLIGGAVRDLFFGKKIEGLDIVTEGDGINLGINFARRIGAKNFKKSLEFHTFKVNLENIQIEFATTREEYYPQLAKLPKIKRFWVPLSEDIKRRDFTINTLALGLNKADFFKFYSYHPLAYEDLKRGILRTLHKNSFKEDPTRILRGVRFLVKLKEKLTWEINNFNLAKEAINQNLLEELTPERRRKELELLLSTPYQLEFTFNELNKLAALEHLFLELNYNTPFKTKLRHLIWYYFRFFKKEGLNFFSLLLLFLAANLNSLKRENFAYTLNLRHHERKLLSKLDELPSIELNLEKETSKFEIYKLLSSLPPELLNILSCGKEKGVRKKIFLYLNELRYIKPYLTTKDFIELGLKPSILFRYLEEELIKLRIEGKLKTKEEEKDFILRVKQ